MDFPGHSEPARDGREALDQLRDLRFTMALNTGKDRPRTQAFLQRFGLEGFFSTVVTGDDVIRGKPAPDSLQMIAQSHGAACHELLFIGDTPIDLRCAGAAGSAGVAALWGVGDEAEIRACRPDYLARSARDLVKICQSFDSKVAFPDVGLPRRLCKPARAG